ncbi:MAG TPA: tetratricopeptide repeat protein [Pyrinomonadaceae bacterium]|nr:tetratricopeptide repeat protein [Pyrinomonadaceae bacterium]
METEVRTQIKSQQDVLIATAKDANSSEDELSIAYGMLGEIYHAYSLNAPAAECYLNASRLAPTDFRWVYLLAKLDHQQGHAEEALRGYQVATSLQPSFVTAQLNLGNLYLELDRLDEAKATFALVVQKEPNNASAHYGLGQIALSKRNYAAAVEHFEKALELVPGANRIHYPLALAYRGLRNTEKAEAHLAQQGTVGLRVADPLLDRLAELVQGARVHMIRGKLALEAKRYVEAAGEFRKAIEAQPESVPAYVNLGTTLTQLGELKEAAAQFDKALRLEPSNLTAHFNLAILLANDNQHEQAVAHLHAVLTTNPNDLDARMFLARELEKVGLVDEALREYSRLAEADANNEVAVIKRAELLQSKGESKQALDGLEKAFTQYPQKVNTAVMLIYALAASPQLNLRDGPRALKLAQTLYSTTPTLQHGSLLVLAFAESGQCDEAAEWQRRLITEAIKGRDEQLVEKLKAELARYVNVKSCRP